MATDSHPFGETVTTSGNDITAAPGKVQLTREAHDRLRAELEQARTVLRPELSTRLQRERLFGDPDLAHVRVEELEMHLNDVDRRIEGLEGLLAGAEVVGEGPAPDAVEIGTAVTVRYDDGTEETLTLVGPLETNPSKGLVAIESPAGRGLRGQGLGAQIMVTTDGGVTSLKVVRIRRVER